jgi:small-conductance mechanosensitive channel
MDAMEGLQSSWRPALALIVGLPLALLVLNEWLAALRRRDHALAAPVAFLRNAIVPAVGLVVLLDGVLALPGDDLWVRVGHTILWVVLVAGALGLVNAVAFEGADPGSWRARVPKLLRDLVRLGLVLAAAAIVYSQVWGADLSGALTALGLGGLVLGLALQEPLGNLFSGIMLLMERPFEVGDEIEVGDTTGVVQEINWRSVHVVSPGGITRIIPNSSLNGQTITNYSRPLRQRAETLEFGFSYEDAPNKVRAVLEEVARGTPGVLPDPAPYAATVSFADFSVNYKLVVRVPQGQRMAVRNELMTRVWYAARREGLTIPYPMSVNLEHETDAPFHRPEPTALELLARFPKLPAAPESWDATRARRADYARDETVFEAGASIEGLCLLVSGEVSLQVEHGGVPAEIAAVRPGEFFGEAGLHGSQRTESRAVARRDCLCVWLSPDAVREMLERSPALARELGHAFEVRRRTSAAVRSAPPPTPATVGAVPAARGTGLSPPSSPPEL